MAAGDTGARIFDLIANAAQAEAMMRNAYVEQRILEGEDRVELPYLGADDDRTIVYFVPPWKRHPILRWQVERARRRHRRGERQRSWGGR